MRGLRYDELDARKSEHEALLDGIRDLMDRVETDAFANLEEKLSAQLKVWFGRHFATRDARLRRFPEERGIDEATFAREHPDA